MNRAFPIAAVVFLSLGLRGDAQSPSGDPQTNPTIDALVKVSERIKLPAREPGVLIHLNVKEGDEVKAGQQIGQIDDREIQIQMKAAQYAYGAAVKKFEDDVDIRYSDKGAAVAEQDHKKMEEAVGLVEKSITETDRRRAKLEWDKMVLAAEKARKERELARLDALTKHAELEAAKAAMERRNLTAPFDGVVEEIGRKENEWVNPGDTILQLFRMDTMDVEGAVEQKLYDPHQLQGCKVTVEVKMAGDQKKIFEGRITKVSSIIQYHGVFNVRAEIPNRQEHGNWILRDNLPATMTIHLGTGRQAATTSASRPK